MTSLSHWLERIERLHPENIELGLERVAGVHAGLPCAAMQATVITVAGTNGKGSTVECLMQCLLAQGLRVGAYTSPHLRRFNERIRVNGEMVPDGALVEAFESVEQQRGDIALTFFEFTTLAAFEVFHRAQLDVWILEVGLGGRLDAVNILSPEVAIITSIGLDHHDWLGDTREQIALEKAGVMRANIPVICADPNPPLAIATTAHNLHSELHQLGKHFDYTTEQLQWHWRGAGTERSGLVTPANAVLDNLAGALAALEVLGALPDTATLNEVFANWSLEGRLQRVPGTVEWWFDVAHNRESAMRLAAALERSPMDGKCTFVFGVLGDKPVVDMLTILSPYAAAWIAVGLDTPRALPPTEIAGHLRSGSSSELDVMNSVAAGCAVALARSQPGDRIVVTGSFHTVGPALGWLGL